MFHNDVNGFGLNGHLNPLNPPNPHNHPNSHNIGVFANINQQNLIDRRRG